MTTDPAITLDLDAPAQPAALPDPLGKVSQVLRKKLFFIVGCQKSGTTWVQKLLDGHPDVRCHGEGYFVPIMLPLLQQVAQLYNTKHKAGPEGDFTPADLQTLFQAAVGISLARWVGDKQVEAVGEKTPEHALCMKQLGDAFGQAKFIHVIRDGRDACVSGWFHNQRKAGPNFAQKFPTMNHYIQYMVTAHWKPYIEKARAWGQANPQRYMEVRYEDLHADAAQWTQRMLTFLDVDSSEASVQACGNAGSFENLAKGRERGQEDAGSFFRKGIVGDWRNHFDASNEQTFMQHGGELLRQLGYE